MKLYHINHSNFSAISFSIIINISLKAIMIKSKRGGVTMKVLIFDGNCSFCNLFVRFTVRINKNPDLRITDFNTDWTIENHKTVEVIVSIIYIVVDKTSIFSYA